MITEQNKRRNLNWLSNGRPLRVAIVFLLSVVTALACGWSLWIDHSVRFNGQRSGRGFYRLPPLPFMYDSEKGKELTVAQMDEDEYNGEQAYDAERPGEGKSTRDPNKV